jgi:hypothetical protein
MKSQFFVPYSVPAANVMYRCSQLHEQLILQMHKKPTFKRTPNLLTAVRPAAIVSSV